MDGEVTLSAPEQVAILGAVQTRYEARKTHQTYNESVHEVVDQLLTETGVALQEMESIVSASQDLFDGRTISGMAINEVVGGYLHSESKVAGDGIQALLYGAARILAGAYDLTLVVAHCKESEGQFHQITSSMFDPYVERPLGLDEHIAAALQAQRFLAVSGASENDLAQVSRKNHRNAMKNPLARRSGEFSAGQILKSPVVVSPLRDLLAGPITDGACAILLGNPARARKSKRPVSWIAGMGTSTDAYWTDRELAESAALQCAAQRAFAAAGLRNPQQELHVAELSARYAHEELLYLDALHFASGQRAHARLAAGDFDLGGKLPVNPSGGALTGNPTCVAGLARVAEVHLQLTGAAGAHQVPGAGAGLAHGASGICGQSQTVVVLRREASAQAC